MKQKGEFTTLQRAIQTVDGFSHVFETLRQQTALRGQSESTLYNYIHRVALVSLHFKRLPEDISDDEINEYLTTLALDVKSPSRSGFKHTVYGLRYYFRHVGLSKRAIDLPSIKKAFKLPIILNRSELRELFKAPTLLKHRILLTLTYSGGLRSQEVCNLKVADIDFERKTIHIRQSKYNKDRIVPLSEYMAKGLRRYLLIEQPHLWLFEGKETSCHYSSRGVNSIMHSALNKTNIQKEVSIHSLRHSYATHLLEDGLNIVTIKELLGHAQITTTMIYLHVAQCPLLTAHSPLDTLYPMK